MENLEKITRKIHEATFHDKDTVAINRKKYPIEKTSKKGLRCVYYDKNFFVEQNPDTDSHWAEKAKRGDQITWVIKGNDYVANIHNGKLHVFE